MPSGTVKWFNDQKGFGFILPDEKGNDLFVHYSNVQMDGYKVLKEGQRVTFEPQKGEKGMEAKNVVPSQEFVQIAKSPRPATSRPKRSPANKPVTSQV